ncbi:23S rRNA pseudouridine955/2504/2580 synthase/23S rRNA pseudouridine1911/1915/1917 synthase [Thermoflavifilum aggregans]|uniref:23S rRNA pseudouridine955/2504/2580 synthase/23S rRNA pseudouridine1911/1915/1917 synthase n=1 Tax=Thermoflavifilum aggregans TaxID=454188 RepID=A0A2M9CSU6_9BACT|nr:RluA family pseudouridine synthase [Thermoflavifilum aggregans]PJJ74888.1 23S rRNA pseudouridine955/2504/2580 synthase/23S rRNA pseudouridine1911/1915/1917 synthase [Thermoflavifilum aggregans]
MKKNRPEILIEHPDFIAVNKPAGWLSVPDRFDSGLPNLYAWLKEQYGEILIVHRLDKDTSGVIVFARHADAHRWLCEQFATHSIGKTYLGIVEGRVDFEEKTVVLPLAPDPKTPGKMRIHASGREAVTHLKLLESYNRHSLLQMMPATGRTHQIRLHLQHLGYPLVADPLYGSGKPLMAASLYRSFHPGDQERPLIARTALHAAIIELQVPNGQHHRIEAPLPKDIKASLYQLRKTSAAVVQSIRNSSK